MKVIRKLYRICVEHRKENPQTRHSWLRIDKAIADIVPQDKQEAFTRMVEDHCYSVEYGGFADGFKMAMKLWKEI